MINTFARFVELNSDEPHHHEVLGRMIDHFKLKRVIEIGVWKSGMCRHIMRNGYGGSIEEYWMVDPWLVLGEGHGRMSKRDQDNWNRVHLHACSLMLHYPQLRVLRMESELASEIFKDGYFDLVYIDSIHSYDGVTDDVGLWQSKVANKRYLCGHDYGTKKHPEAKVAVNDLFGESGVYVYTASTVWVKVIE